MTLKQRRAPSVTHKWKRLLAVGCSHGEFADPDAIEAVLRFRDAWKPDWVAHVGDAFDTTAFRSGAKGTNDETREIEPDANCGLNFLRKLRPNLYCMGNHEHRLYKLRNHYNAIVSAAAGAFVNMIESTVGEWGATIMPYDIFKGWYEKSGYKYGHGYMFNEMAIRDHAETWGNCVFAHTHQAGVAKGRRSDGPTAYNVGTLTTVPNMDYANGRRKTLSWCAGFVWGEYCDDRSVLWLHQQPQGQKEWRLPV